MSYKQKKEDRVEKTNSKNAIFNLHKSDKKSVKNTIIKAQQML
jgi:hypothetical protein